MTRRLRLLFLGDAKSVHLQRWVSFFAQRHTVGVLSTPPIPAGRDVPFMLLPGSTIPLVPVVTSLADIFFLRRAVQRFKPDVTHVHYLVPGSWISAISGVNPFVATAWGSDVFRVHGISRIMNTYALQRASHVTADSQELLEELTQLGVRRNKLSLIQWGVDITRFQEARSGVLRAELRISEATRVLISPRMMGPLYNIENIVHAFAAIKVDAILVLSTYQASKPYLKKIQHITQSLGIEEKIRWMPPLPHVRMPELYHLADAIISIPSTDSTPVTLLEAMAAGCVPICSDLQSIREWIRNGDNGFLCTPDDVPGITSAIQSALSMPHAAIERLRQQNLTLIVSRADHQQNMDMMEEIYQAIALQQ